MADVSVRPEPIDVEQIMQQLRTRIRERRGAEYTETEVQQLASAKLDHLLDSRGTPPRLAELFFRQRPPSPDVPTYEFEDSTIFATHRGILRGLRGLLRPILKLFFNPDPISRALHLQAEINAEFQRRLRQREELDSMLAEVVRSLVTEVTRAGLEVQSLKLRLESLSTRMDFDDRRPKARDAAAQSGVSHAPASEQPAAQTQEAPGGNRPDQRASPGATTPSGDRRRRRRRRRRRGWPGQAQPAWGSEQAGSSAAPNEAVGPTSAGPDGDSGSFDAADDDVSDSDEP